MPKAETGWQTRSGLRAIIDASPEAVLLVDRDGRIAFANARVRPVFGYAPEDLVGQPVEVLVPLGDRDAHARRRGGLAPGGAHRGFGVHTDLLARRADGSVFPVDIALTPLELDGASGVVASVMDVGDRHRLEAQLLQAQKMELMGRFAAMLAHDFRNYLTAIGGLADLAAGYECHAERPIEELALIQTAVATAEATVAGVLGLSRPAEAGDSTDVAALLAQSALLLERLALPPGRVAITVEDGLPDVAIAPSALTQILMNLVTNARDAMPGGGRVGIAARLEPGGLPAGPGEPPASCVAISVSDTGSGMDEATAARVFEPFFSTKGAPGRVGSGSGLGLASVAMLVRRASGTIRLSTSPGAGTTFEVLLPLAGAG